MDSQRLPKSRNEHWLSGARSASNFNSFVLVVSDETGILIRCVVVDAVCCERSTLPTKFPFMKTVKPERLKSSKPEWLKVISRYVSSVAVYPGGIVKRTKVSARPTPFIVRMLYPRSSNVRVSCGSAVSTLEVVGAATLA